MRFSKAQVLCNGTIVYVKKPYDIFNALRKDLDSEQEKNRSLQEYIRKRTSTSEAQMGLRMISKFMKEELSLYGGLIKISLDGDIIEFCWTPGTFLGKAYYDTWGYSPWRVKEVLEYIQSLKDYINYGVDTQFYLSKREEEEFVREFFGQKLSREDSDKLLSELKDKSGGLTNWGEWSCPISLNDYEPKMVGVRRQGSCPRTAIYSYYPKGDSSIDLKTVSMGRIACHMPYDVSGDFECVDNQKDRLPKGMSFIGTDGKWYKVPEES